MPEPIESSNEEPLKADLREPVRRTVEEMPDGLLDEEADDLVGAEHCERTADREAYRAGHYERKLTTTSGEVTIRMPKLNVFSQVLLSEKSSPFFRVWARNFFGFGHGRAASFLTCPA